MYGGVYVMHMVFMWCLCGEYGVYMVCIGEYGVYMVCMWCVHGIYVVYMIRM